MIYFGYLLDNLQYSSTIEEVDFYRSRICSFLCSTPFLPKISFQVNCTVHKLPFYIVRICFDLKKVTMGIKSYEILKKYLPKKEPKKVLTK